MALGDSINVKMFTVKLASDDITAQQSGEYYTSQYFLMKARDRVRDRMILLRKFSIATKMATLSLQKSIKKDALNLSLVW